MNYPFYGCHLELQRNHYFPPIFSILIQVWFILFCGLLVSDGSTAEIAKLFILSMYLMELLPKSDFPVKSQIIQTTEACGMNQMLHVASAPKLRNRCLFVFAWFENVAAVSLRLCTVNQQNNLALFKVVTLCKTALCRLGCGFCFFVCGFFFVSPWVIVLNRFILVLLIKMGFLQFFITLFLGFLGNVG